MQYSYGLTSPVKTRTLLIRTWTLGKINRREGKRAGKGKKKAMILDFGAYIVCCVASNAADVFDLLFRRRKKVEPAHRAQSVREQLAHTFQHPQAANCEECARLRGDLSGAGKDAT